MNENKITICIPKISIQIQKKYVLNTFVKLGIGIIERIQEMPIKSDQNHKRIVIHLHLNMNNENAKYICDFLCNNKTIKIVHDMPWYWICTKYSNSYESKINCK